MRDNMSERAIVVKRGQAWAGILDGTTFVPEMNTTAWKFQDASLKEELEKGYISLHEFLRLTNPRQTKKESEACRKEIGYTQVYIYVEDNDDFWAYTNHKCNTCKRECKQSSKVEVVSCPQYEEIDG
jgi:hypothetical protein